MQTFLYFQANQYVKGRLGSRAKGTASKGLRIKQLHTEMRCLSGNLPCYDASDKHR